MAWQDFRVARYYPLFGLLVGIMLLSLAIFWYFKMRNIQHVKSEIVRLETKLISGQQVWRTHPPLTAAQRRDLERAQEGLFRRLPKEKEIPSLLEEISQLAREHLLVDLSFNTGAVSSAPGTGPAAASTQPVAAAPQTARSGAVAASEGSKPIESFPIRVLFAGDYREIAYFLEALRKLPRLVTIESVRVQRGIPLLPTEVTLHGYYRKGELPVAGK